MLLSGYVVSRMLSYVKSRRGCTLEELAHKLPRQYQNPDEDPETLALEAMIILVQWDLVEAYDKEGAPLTLRKLQKFPRWEPPTEAKFYITKQAVDMEQFLGVHLDMGGRWFFGEPSRPDYSWPKVFVAMPFTKTLKPVYESHIREVFKNLGISVGRGDNFFTIGSIMADIWAAINAASLIIADCTGRNPNVFYELGIAHTLGKQTILIAQSMKDVPFDVAYLRVIIYRNDPEGLKDLEVSLKEVVVNTLEIST